MSSSAITGPVFSDNKRATAGVSGALPAQVAGYIEISINGNNRKIPYYL